MLLLHQFEELCIVLRFLELVEEEFHGLDFIHVVDELTQHPGLLEHFRIQQQLFAAGARAREIDGREDALFSHAAFKVDFVVARALEFFVDHVVHARARVNERGADNRERAAFFDIAGRAEDALGPFECVGVDAAVSTLPDDGITWL